MGFHQERPNKIMFDRKMFSNSFHVENYKYFLKQNKLRTKTNTMKGIFLYIIHKKKDSCSRSLRAIILVIIALLVAE